ncbi:MAG: aspartate kinase [Alphaproteobacteria bacterium]|nr:aspartate kinase [Alphaproteobacteria bacterium]MDX5370719.1 aspartate kinase [Alphaproteobacteria bacterium]MDX5465136.1 aspartate kinase [Alphaproteobacteria bacterium]
MAHTVEKIGGTSMVQTETLLNNILIGNRRTEEIYNRIFVVSAYAGMTNALLEHKKTGEPGVYALFASSERDWSWGDALSRVADRMLEINAEIFEDKAARRSADTFIKERIEGVRSCLIDLNRLCSYGHFRLDEHLFTVREMLSALGEAQSAYNTTLLLQQHGVNARFIDLTGWREDDQPDFDDRIETAFADVDLSSELPIVTGYAQCREQLMRSFDRGYTEVTLSRIAVITGASEAIIHKEFHLSSADPNLVGEDAVRPIGETNYDVADQLSNMGMEAIHPRAAKGLRQANIPLRVRNIFEADHMGTVIRADLEATEPGVEIVTGLKGVFAFEFFEQDMVGVKGYDAAILEALKRHKVRIVSKSSNANTITHFLEGSMKAVKRVEADLSKVYPSASITSRKVAIISAIGRDLTGLDVALTGLASLKAAGIKPLGLHDHMRKVDMQVIVDEPDFDGAVVALHRGLIEGKAPEEIVPAAGGHATPAEAATMLRVA